MSPNTIWYPALRVCAITGYLTLVLAGCASVTTTNGDDTGSASVDTAMGEAPALDNAASATPVAPEPASQVRLKTDHPERYTVQRGDTLWGISERFLEDPWLWPEVWQLNPEIRNPHLIYPGDVVGLTLAADGKPGLRLESRGRPVVKLSPQVRERSIARAIPPIPLDKIVPFLDAAAVLMPDEWAALPYIVAQDDGLIIGADERFYGRGLATDDAQVYGVYRPDRDYLDPVTGELLGRAGIYVGTARLEHRGDPSTLFMERSQRQGLPGDRLYSRADEYPTQFVPTAGAVSGLIMAVLDGVTQIGQYQNIVINRGRADGLEPGDVLGVLRSGEVAQDPVTGAAVKLPDERSGLVLVYRTFDRLSYALVMRATRSMHVGDQVVPPDLAPI